MSMPKESQEIVQLQSGKRCTRYMIPCHSDPTSLLPICYTFGSRYDKRLRDVPLLTPMTIIAAKYNDRYEFIIWKLHLDNGREVIGASRYRDADVTDNGNDKLFLGRSIGGLLLKIPASLTSQEVTAISNRKLFRGMSRQAVIYSWGPVEEENDYGEGGKQLAYGKTNLFTL